MSMHLWLAFVAASALLVAIPGPTALTLVSYSVSHGRGNSALLVLAVMLGDSTALTLSLLGLGALLATSALWFEAVKWIGGLYLIYIGIRLARSGRGSVPQAAAATPGTRRRLFANTYLVTAFNPKGIMFFIAFLPQFVNPGAAAVPQLWLLSVTFVIVAAISATLYTLFAASIRKVLHTPRAQSYFNLAGGSLLTVAGAWVLLAKRGV
ncbi:LysE family translocator [Acidihalobacter prosperus]